jgi:hypothetical protein
MTIGVTFEEDDTNLGRGVCFCYFYHLGSINEIELAIWIINFTLKEAFTAKFELKIVSKLHFIA